MVESQLPLIPVLKRILNPIVVGFTLIAVVLGFGSVIDTNHILLLILVFLITILVYDETGLDHCWRRSSFILHIRDILVGWLVIIGIMLFFAYVTELFPNYDRRIILTWFAITPAVIFLSHLTTRYMLYQFYLNRGISRSCVIVGLSNLGIKLEHRLRSNLITGIKVCGFFDDRDAKRLADVPQHINLIGALNDIADYVRNHRVEFVYITLPMVSQPRIMALLEELRDTTVSVYFVPDIFVFDLLHASFGQIEGIPIISVRDTPMLGVSGFNKRVIDVVFSFAFLIILSPLLLLIGLGVKLSSPGSVLFRQRRYGLNGDEILVYKFRSMMVSEDGAHIPQAQKNDPRITPFGAFLRRSSLDELPQFLNVLEGSMSIVGPRPHAIAHNETYRKLIPGYMMRHKVKPGITGWAQVNGLRGETETLDKMRSRIEYDIDYIRNWSLHLDLIIMLRTMLVLVRNKNTY